MLTPGAALERSRWPAGATVAVVVVGGCVGTALRYGVGQRFVTEAGSWPTTTLAENVVGAALLGLLVAAVAANRLSRRWLRPLLATGVLGSFTTFSTFATECVLLVRDDQVAIAASYVVATLVCGLTAAAAGHGLGRRWWHRPSTTDAELGT